MNKVILKGIISKDIDYRSTVSGVEVVSFNLAVKRDFKNKDGNYDADFINLVAYKNTANFINKYFEKGSKILLEGRLQTRNYEAKNGTRVYVTEVIVEKAEFVGDKKDNSNNEHNEVPQNIKSEYEETDETQLTDEDIDKAFEGSLPF